MGDADEVVDRDPFVESVRAAGVGPCVMPGMLASAQNVLQSSQKGFAPNGTVRPSLAAACAS